MLAIAFEWRVGTGSNGAGHLFGLAGHGGLTRASLELDSARDLPYPRSSCQPPTRPRHGSVRMEIYDIVMIVVLVGAMIFGAIKGFAWQLASIASIVSATPLRFNIASPSVNRFRRIHHGIVSWRC